MQFPRSAGVLLHVTSLPGGDGIGDLGPSAYQFVDFLSRANQSIWQVLPLGPPARGNSPYSCYSAFAGNPLMISRQRLVDDGWCDAADVSRCDVVNDRTAQFEAALRCKHPFLRQIFDRQRDRICDDPAYRGFLKDNDYWLPDFARFEALMQHFAQPDWTGWPEPLVQRQSEALEQWDRQLGDEIEYSRFLQFLFDQQWRSLRSYANERGVQIFGDMPIFVAHESADVWAHQSLFELEPTGHRRLVAGVPPDYFSATGQLWGNPLYRWDELDRTGYRWWIERFRFAFKQFDLLRVDHFRGFEAYWEIPASAETAIEGQWRKGPGTLPFDAARKELGPLPIIAEDLGLITEAVHQLRQQLDFPAMRVLQFGFDDPNDVFHHPNHYPSDSVAYTGTHDNDTLMGWYAQRPIDADDDAMLRSLLNDQSPVNWQLIEAVLQSGSDIAVVPVQDLLALGNEARMNLPGQADGNWAWRMMPDDLDEAIQSRLAMLTRAADRSAAPTHSAS